MKTLLINKEDLRHNIETIKTHAYKGNKDYLIIGVVKGNGYGLDLIQYSKFLIDNGINTLAVATTEEALELRENGIKQDILMLSSVQDSKQLETLINNNIIITIGSKESADEVLRLSKNHKIKAHIKIDTGFGRYGFIYNKKEEILETIKKLNDSIAIEGIFSHFSMSYYKKNKHTIQQYNRFLEIINLLEKEAINIKYKHICNSSGFINYPEMRLNAARIGSAFLGRVSAEENIGLKKIAKLVSSINEIKVLPKKHIVSYLNTYKTKKSTKAAIIPIGYLDGYNVGLKNDMFRFRDKLIDIYHILKSFIKNEKLKVKINKKEYKVIGKVGMYHIVIDITNSDVNINDLVYINVNPLYISNKIRREYT